MDTNKNWEEILRQIPDLPQRQDSTLDQLKDLLQVAIKLGMYDAVDLINSCIPMR